MTSCRLATVAVLAMIAAGAALLERHDRPAAAVPTMPAAPRREAAATATPIAPATSTPTAASPALRVARAYALAATNWSAATFAAARRRRTRLATGALRSELRARPAPGQLTQLRADRESRLGAPLAVLLQTGTAMRATVAINVDELRIAAGRRVRQIVRYRVQLRRDTRGWRVTVFGARRSRTP